MGTPWNSPKCVWFHSSFGILSLSPHPALILGLGALITVNFGEALRGI